MKKDCELIVFKMLDLDGDNVLNVVDDFETYNKFVSTTVLAKDLMGAFLEQFMVNPGSNTFSFPHEEEGVESSLGR